MTAFARAQAEFPWGTAVWEMRSVNNRYLEASARLPEELRSIEGSVRERLRVKLGRGKVDCNLRVSWHQTRDGGLNIDMDVAKQIVAAAQAVEALLDNGSGLAVADVLRWPGVIRPIPLDLDAVSAQVLTLLDESVADLIAGREREGERISQLIETRLAEIELIVQQVRERLPVVLEASRERLVERLAELKEQLDTDRVEQEMVILAQRLDVAEELDRLDAHTTEVRRCLDQSEPVGRRLDFMMQELNREANTLGSKSSDSQVTRASVDLKVLIEQMREQIQNIE